MPIYEYQCQACGGRHEAIQKFSEGPLRKCPACGRLKLKRLVSAAAFHLKGTGWYVTDFRDKDKKKPAEGKNEGGGESKSGDGESKSGDSKESTASKDGAGSTDNKDSKPKETKKEGKPRTGGSGAATGD